jgi:hypothetical protein
MVDRTPIEDVQDVKRAIFELSNAAGKLGQDFTAWEDIAFTPEGPPDFIVIREGLRALNYTAMMMLQDVLDWCAANTPRQDPIYQRVVVSSATEAARPYNLKHGERITAIVDGHEVRLELA